MTPPNLRIDQRLPPAQRWKARAQWLMQRLEAAPANAADSTPLSERDTLQPSLDDDAGSVEEALELLLRDAGQRVGAMIAWLNTCRRPTHGNDYCAVSHALQLVLHHYSADVHRSQELAVCTRDLFAVVRRGLALYSGRGDEPLLAALARLAVVLNQTPLLRPLPSSSSSSLRRAVEGLPLLDDMLTLLSEQLQPHPPNDGSRARYAYAKQGISLLASECARLRSMRTPAPSSLPSSSSAPSTSPHPLLLDALEKGALELLDTSPPRVNHTLLQQQHLYASLMYALFDRSPSSLLPHLNLPPTLLPPPPPPPSPAMLCFLAARLSRFWPDTPACPTLDWTAIFHVEPPPTPALGNSREEARAILSTQEKRTTRRCEAEQLLRLLKRLIDQAELQLDAMAPASPSTLPAPSNADTGVSATFRRLLSSAPSASHALSLLRSSLASLCSQLLDPTHVGQWLLHARSGDQSVPLAAVAAFLAPLYDILADALSEARQRLVTTADASTAASASAASDGSFVAAILPSLVESCFDDASASLVHPNAHAEPLECCLCKPLAALTHADRTQLSEMQGESIEGGVLEWQLASLTTLSLEAGALMRYMVDRSVHRMRKDISMKAADDSALPPCLLVSPPTLSPRTALSALWDMLASLHTLNARVVEVKRPELAENPTWLSLPTAASMLRVLLHAAQHPDKSAALDSSTRIEAGTLALQLLSALLPSLTNLYHLPLDEFKRSRSGLSDQPLPSMLPCNPFSARYVPSDDDDSSDSDPSPLPPSIPPPAADPDKCLLRLHYHTLPWLREVEAQLEPQGRTHLSSLLMHFHSDKRYLEAFSETSREQLLALLTALLAPNAAHREQLLSELAHLLPQSDDISMAHSHDAPPSALLALVVASFLWREFQSESSVECVLAYLSLLEQLVPPWQEADDAQHGDAMMPAHADDAQELRHALSQPLVSVHNLASLQPASFSVCVLLQRVLKQWPFEQPALLQRWHHFLLTRLPLLPSQETLEPDTEDAAFNVQSVDASSIDFASTILGSALQTIGEALERYLASHVGKKRQMESDDGRLLFVDAQNERQLDDDDSDGENDADESFHPNKGAAKTDNPRRAFDEAVAPAFAALKLHLSYLHAILDARMRRVRVQMQTMQAECAQLEAEERFQLQQQEQLLAASMSAEQKTATHAARDLSEYDFQKAQMRERALLYAFPEDEPASSAIQGEEELLDPAPAASSISAPASATSSALPLSFHPSSMQLPAWHSSAFDAQLIWHVGALLRRTASEHHWASLEAMLPASWIGGERDGDNGEQRSKRAKLESGASDSHVQAPMLRSAKDVFQQLQRLIDVFVRTTQIEAECVDLLWRSHTLQQRREGLDVTAVPLPPSLLPSLRFFCFKTLPLMPSLRRWMPPLAHTPSGPAAPRLDCMLESIARTANALAQTLPASPDDAATTEHTEHEEASELCAELLTLLEPHLAALRASSSAQCVRSPGSGRGTKRRASPPASGRSRRSRASSPSPSLSSSPSAPSRRLARARARARVRKHNSGSTPSLPVRSRNRYIDTVARLEGERGSWRDLEEFIEDDLSLSVDADLYQLDQVPLAERPSPTIGLSPFASEEREGEGEGEGQQPQIGDYLDQERKETNKDDVPQPMEMED